jgi:DNA topoisomerase-1
MIWKRTLACQMASAEFDTVAVDLAVGEDAVFRATGQTIAFPGFIAVYLEGADDSEPDEQGETKLPPLIEGERVAADRVFGEQHFTQPPPRFTEASLVKALEEHGIGRPSTYASIISTLLDREYAVFDRKRLVPTPMGRLVTCFLTRHFFHYVDYDFTANMEDRLDDVSNGKRTHTRILSDFWKDLDGQLAVKKDVDRGCPTEEPCPKCGKHPLFLQASKRGLFFGCAGYPACDYTRPFGTTAAEAEEAPRPPLGIDPATGLEVRLLNGRYGWYVQLGEAVGKAKPRRASVPKEAPPEAVTLEHALRYLSLPRELGMHPETGKPIVASIGRFGAYLLHDGKFKSIPGEDDVYTIGLGRALEVLAMPAKRRGAEAGGTASAETRELGPHPDDGKAVRVLNGRYGWYVKHGSVNATVPKRMDPSALTLAEAVAILGERAAKGPGRRPATRRKKAA